MRIEQEVWKSAAIIASNLSELELTLGDVHGAVRDAEQSVVFADRSSDAFQRMSKRATLADGLHQAGRRADGGVFGLKRKPLGSKARRRTRRPGFLSHHRQR